ncbi:MAG TPA: cell envelope integrity protein CreD [Flavipsychrobacter sp.]|nr:cell envelope integrity protein CreD [Flavipsychrobacter sp.]
MENTHQTNSQPSGFLDRNRTIIKGFLIGFLILLMFIPTTLIQNLVQEREQRQHEVINEISSKWATSQTIVGPLLVVPYKEYTKDNNGKVLEARRNVYLLPDQLLVNGNVLPEVRNRSLYDVTLYRSVLHLSGSFNPESLKALQLAEASFVWSEAKLLLGIDDARGLEEEASLNWNEQYYLLDAGVPENSVVAHGLSTTVSFDSTTQVKFSFQLKLKGSENLYFTPVGRSTGIVLRSSWKHPAFDGQYLPVSHKISDSGFHAAWKVLQVSRNYPQAWMSGQYELKKSAFGVRLIQPTDNYAKTERSVKYAILFIALTFTVFFFLEVLQKRQVHPLQYILVGFSLCIFYSLLLSISEYTGFNPAYLIAATATVLLIGLYVRSIFKQGKVAMIFTSALSGLYTYIFVLIQLQDYALLFGSIGLFLIIAVLMYFSKKIDWYNTTRGN